MAFDPDALRRSFAVVERRADQVALYFYAHLFSHNPGLRELFPEEMGEQRDRLFAALTQLVLRLDSPERLVGYLRTLGQDHRKFQVRPEDYPAVGASLVAALRYFSGDAWTADAEKAWAEAYGVMANTMIDAARRADAESPAWWEARVVAHRRPVPDVAVITLAPDAAYPFTPGQNLSLCSERVPRVWRPYSIANAPRADGTMDIHVRKVPGGRLSTALVDRVAPGERVRLGAPTGHVRLDPGSPRPLLAVAGGTGWAQTRAILEHQAVSEPRRRAVLFVSARSEADLHDLPAIRTMAGRWPWLEVVIAAPAARLLRARLVERGSWAGYDGYLSGPPEMVSEMVRLLVAQGADPASLHHDPLPVTAARSPRPSAADWFLQRRDIPWINRAELGGGW
ncbi:globin domain-containing protein [Streptomyces sp. NPDC014806]|uniref:globin domain-containing protein n=1 Tax=Streptomyces sp. NPDC014806 TaxID=3364920 RepID=UPI0036FC1C96